MLLFRRPRRVLRRRLPTPPSSAEDRRRIAIIQTALPAVCPPRLEHVELRLTLNDSNTAGVRRHLGRHELAVGRPLVDAIGDRPEFRTYLAHEMGHLIDRRLNLSLVPCAAAAVAGAAAILWQTNVLPGPRWLAFATLYAMVGLVIGMTALMRRSEYRADRAAADLTSPAQVRAMLDYIATQPEPPRWQQFIATHPTTRQRIDHLSRASESRRARPGPSGRREQRSRPGGAPPARPRRRG